MISSSEGISDLLFAVGRPPIVEDHGVLEEFPVETATGVLDATQIEQIAAQLMGDDDRLKNEFATYGSCDCSYALAALARFRVNIFKQNGRQAIVMRKLQTEIPTLEDLAAPADLQGNDQGEERDHFRDGRHRQRKNDDARRDVE